MYLFICLFVYLFVEITSFALSEPESEPEPESDLVRGPAALFLGRSYKVSFLWDGDFLIRPNCQVETDAWTDAWKGGEAQYTVSVLLEVGYCLSKKDGRTHRDREMNMR